MERIEAVRQYRKRSNSSPTQKNADQPMRFHVENLLTQEFLAIPEVSYERRYYIPIGYFSSNYLASNLVSVINNANLYIFGVVTSWMHNAWMRAVAGRLESRYRYSNEIVYNNFPWPDPTNKQYKKN